MNHSVDFRFFERKSLKWATLVSAFSSPPSSATMGESGGLGSSLRTQKSEPGVSAISRPMNCALTFSSAHLTPASSKYSSEVVTADCASSFTSRRRVRMESKTTFTDPPMKRRKLSQPPRRLMQDSVCPAVTSGYLAMFFPCAESAWLPSARGCGGVGNTLSPQLQTHICSTPSVEQYVLKAMATYELARLSFTK